MNFQTLILRFWKKSKLIIEIFQGYQGYAFQVKIYFSSVNFQISLLIFGKMIFSLPRNFFRDANIQRLHFIDCVFGGFNIRVPEIIGLGKLIRK